MRAEEDIQEYTATHSSCDVGMGGSLAKVCYLYRSCALTVELLPLPLPLGFDIVRTNRTSDWRFTIARCIILVYLAISIRPNRLLLVAGASTVRMMLAMTTMVTIPDGIVVRGRGVRWLWGCRI